MAIKQLLSTLAVGLAVSCTGVAAQAVETPDFNVSQALLEKGIDIAALPGLAEYAVTAHEGSLERRDTSVGCAIAVCRSPSCL